MILSDEPGYYKPGAYGIRIENLVAVEARGKPEDGDRKLLGFRTLTFCPIDRRLIVTDLLTHDERLWLDAYHAEVRDELQPVDERGRRWLERPASPSADHATRRGGRPKRTRDPALDGAHARRRSARRGRRPRGRPAARRRCCWTAARR